MSGQFANPPPFDNCPVSKNTSFYRHHNQKLFEFQGSLSQHQVSCSNVKSTPLKSRKIMTMIFYKLGLFLVKAWPNSDSCSFFLISTLYYSETKLFIVISNQIEANCLALVKIRSKLVWPFFQPLKICRVPSCGE